MSAPYRTLFWLIWATWLVHAWPAGAAGQLCLQNYQPERHYRFHNCRGRLCDAFIGKDQDWSGIGRFTNNVKWITMISPTIGITAHHQRPTLNSEAYFFVGNGPTAKRVGPFRVIYRTGDANDRFRLGHEVGGAGSDLALVQLHVPVTDYRVTTYPILVLEDQAGQLDLKRYRGREILVWGRDQANSARFSDVLRQMSMRVGRNRVLAVFTGARPGIQRITYTHDAPGQRDSVGADEALLKFGDSGGPTFMEIGQQQAALIGLHYGATAGRQPCGQEPRPSAPHRSEDSAVFPHVEALQKAISTITSGDEKLAVIKK